MRRFLPVIGLAAIAVFAFAATASANVATRHFLKMYKVEKQVDLEGEFPDQYFHEHAFCDAGDYAVDGMWRIDHVDQANPQIGDFGDTTSVQIDASYGDDVQPEKWHFRGFNNATGRAQLKLFVTCLGGQTTQVAGHTHSVNVGPRRNFVQNGGSALTGPLALRQHNFTCGPGELAVAPGFNFTSAGDPNTTGNFANSGRLYLSYPTPNFRSWTWGFVVPAGPSNVTFYLRCLAIKTGPGGGPPAHAHNIIANWHDGAGGSERHIPVGDQQGWEEREDCGDHEKGLVGGFAIEDPFHVYYLGQDPRIKQRAFRFWNQGGGSDRVWVNALCVNDRVDKQIAP